MDSFYAADNVALKHLLDIVKRQQPLKKLSIPMILCLV